MYYSTINRHILTKYSNNFKISTNIYNLKFFQYSTNSTTSNIFNLNKKGNNKNMNNDKNDSNTVNSTNELDKLTVNKNDFYSYHDNIDYIKYFKRKKDLMKSFNQGYITKLKLTGPNYNNYCKFKLRQFR